jgi:sodium transport system permease protein
MFERLWIVFAKEAIDNFRDRRSLAMALAYPFIGPVLVGALVAFVGMTITALPTTSYTLPIQGAENGPALVAYLEAKGANVVPAPVNPAYAVRTGQYDTALIIPPDYESRFEGGRQAAVHLVVDGSRLSAVVAMSWTLAALGDYNAEVSDIRLKALGLDAAVAVPLKIKQLNVAVGRNLTGFFLNMMPPFLIFTIFIGGVYLAIDTTSGERERGSLEPLLANPIARWELMLGKALAAMAFTAMAVIVQLIAFKLVFEVITWGEYGLEVDLGPGMFVTAFFVCLPLMVLAVAIQIIVATLTRSFKETQTYLGLLPLVPSLPGLVLVFVSVNAHPWMMAIPTFGQTLLIGQLARGEPVENLDMALAAMTTGLVGALLLLLAARLYDRDALLFGAQ